MKKITIEETKALLDEYVALEKEHRDYLKYWKKNGVQFWNDTVCDKIRDKIFTRESQIEDTLKNGPYIVIKNAKKIVGACCDTGMHTTLDDLYCSTLDQLPIESRGRIVALPYYINLDGSTAPVKTWRGIQYHIQNRDGVICIKPHNLVEGYVLQQLGPYKNEYDDEEDEDEEDE